MPTLTIDGVEFEMSPEQISQIEGSREAAANEPPPVPNEISDRQFFQQLAMLGVIPKNEAIDAVSIGSIPSAMEAFFAGMSDDEEFAARMILQGATKFERNHPLVQAFGAMNGWNSDQIDQFWRDASVI